MLAHPPFHADPALPEPMCARLEHIAAVIEQIADQIVRAPAGDVQNVLAAHRQTFYNAMGALGTEIFDFLAANPSPDQIKDVRHAIAAQLGRWSNTSPIYQHNLRKPRSQTLDPEVTKALLSVRPVGADTPALIFSDYYRHAILGTAYRNRLIMLIEAVRRAVSARAGAAANPVRVLCLHVSGAGEILTLAQDPTFAKIAQVTCLDSRAAALRETRRQVQGWLEKPCRFVRVDSLRSLAQPDPSQSYHLIYGVGVFEHLDMDMALRLAQAVHAALAPGGALNTGSVTAEVPIAEQILYAWLTTTRVQYRDEAAWQSIFMGAGFATLGFAYEKHRANVLISAEKGQT